MTPTPHISLDVHALDFRWLWLMYVHGFNERHHCQACLRGHKTKKLTYDRNMLAVPLHVSFDLDEYHSPYMYLCGVTPKYNMNLHIAFEPAHNSEVVERDPRLSIVISNARRVPILPVDADLPQEFSRCRNFQFGYRYLRDRQSLLSGVKGDPRNG